MPDEVRVEAARRYIASYEIVTGQTLRPRHRAIRSRGSPRALDAA